MRASGKRDPKASASRTQRIAQLHAEGMTNQQIAARLETTTNIVGPLVSRLGLKPNQPGSRVREIVDRAPWEDTAPIDRRETAPRSHSHMVSLPRDRVTEPGADVLGAIAAIRAAHQAVREGVA